MTQIDYAKKGIPTNEMKLCADFEKVNIEIIMDKIANGKAVLPKNKNHLLKKPVIIGQGFSIKVNANIGTSFGYCSLNEEIKKMKIAIEAGTDTIMILSTCGNLREIRREIIKQSSIPVGSVPIYDSAVKSFEDKKNVIDFSEKDFLNMIIEHAEDGIDFITIHVGIRKKIIDKVKNTKRILKVVSRGGSIILGWMVKNNKENPFYEHFDEILNIAKEYDITLSLGDGMRPGALVDSTDSQQIDELIEIGELVNRCHEKNVQVIVEGPGHLPLNDIEMNIKLMKKISNNSPIFLLGPLPTDRGIGYDHLVSAVGGALAGYYGCDFLCCVTPSEHLSLPTAEDIREGVVASKIAATIAEVAKGNKNFLELEERMAIARSRLDWEKMFEIAINSDKAIKKYKKRPYKDKGCSMCGPFCAIKIAQELN